MRVAVEPNLMLADGEYIVNIRSIDTLRLKFYFDVTSWHSWQTKLQAENKSQIISDSAIQDIGDWNISFQVRPLGHTPPLFITYSGLSIA